MGQIKDFLLKLLEWIGSSAFRLFTVVLLLLLMTAGWILYSEKDLFVQTYKAQQALPKMNGEYEKAVSFILKNTNAELIAIFEVNTLLNTRKLVWLQTRKGGRIRGSDGMQVGLLTKNHQNNKDVIDLMAGSMPCHPYKQPQSQIGFLYKDVGINFMCRISVPSEPGTFIGQISVGWKEEIEESETLEKMKTVMIVASSMLFNTHKD
jgi:hypothetical protein